MAMSEDREKEIYAKMDNLANAYMEKEIETATVGYTENLAIVFTYKRTANLVKLSEDLVKHSIDLIKQSSRLTVLTWMLFGTAVGMIFLALVQLLVLLKIIPW